ncbi:hypothetical protein ILYODFUR_038409 [Ilyodon furcidens]|uniref:Uncharacterized protein n=1 Tax=Ilyodon furcidens TaxID=33524 RepID=A0ABV0VC19_9TELE
MTNLQCLSWFLFQYLHEQSHIIISENNRVTTKTSITSCGSVAGIGPVQSPLQFIFYSFREDQGLCNTDNNETEALSQYPHFHPCVPELRVPVDGFESVV